MKRTTLADQKMIFVCKHKLLGLCFHPDRMSEDIHYTSYLGSEWNQKPKTESRVYDSTSPAKGKRTFPKEIPYILSK